MKIFIAMLLMMTVLSSEVTHMINMGGVDMTQLDANYEGEVDKESKELTEDFSKLKIKQNIIFVDDSNSSLLTDVMDYFFISTPYLEIHSPPPDARFSF